MRYNEEFSYSLSKHILSSRRFQASQHGVARSQSILSSDEELAVLMAEVIIGHERLWVRIAHRSIYKEGY